MQEHNTKKYVTVTTVETLKEMIKHIRSCKEIAYDTETTGLNVRKDKIVGWSISGSVGVGYYLPTLVWNPEKEVLEECEIDGISSNKITARMLLMLLDKQLIMHNASFDIRMTKNNYGVDLINALWVDTALLVHTLQEEGAFGFPGSPFALKSIAIMNQKELGLDVQEAANQEQIRLKESIKKNGGSVTKVNYEIYKADLEVLSEYAAADTDLTLRICYLYLQKLQHEDLVDFFFKEEVMPIYVEVTIPMEEYGVDLDMELLYKTREEILIDLEENKKIVMKSLLDTNAAQAWAVDKALSEFKPSNKGNWGQEYCRRFSLDLPKSEKTGKYSLTQKNIEKLEDSNHKKFLLTGDINLVEELERIRISMHLWKESNNGEYINIQSKRHLGEIVFKYMGIKSQSITDKGTKQFDMEMLEELAKEHDWAENLRVYNKLLKIKSTYIDRFIDNSEDGRYYFYFKQHGTVSGRYGSDAQQLPKPKEDGEDSEIILHYNNLVRAFIIAGKGRKVIDADYESLEPHCFASVAKDENLREIFNKGWDFYSTVAIQTEGLKGVSPDKKAPNYLKKINPVGRNKAKAYSLGIAYGMSPYALAMTLNISQKEAKRLVEGYLSGFPELRNWIEDSRLQVKAHGFIRNQVGRVRHLPKVQLLYLEFGDQLMDWKFRQSLEGSLTSDEIQSMYRDYRNGLNNCLNFQLQSLAAAIVNRAAVQINRKAKEMGIDAIVQAQVHDQLLINVAEEDAERFAPIVKHIMETTTVLEGVTLKAPPEIADNWREGH